MISDRDFDRVRREGEETARSVERLQGEDVVIEFPRRLKLRSPDGTYWILGVDDTGALTTENAGVTP